MTVCLYLPDGRVGFMFKRPEVTHQRRVRLGRHALRGDRAVRAPEGDATRARSSCSTTRWPWPTRGPPSRRTPTPSARPSSTTAGSATCSAASPRRPTRSPGEEFAKGHYEQLVRGVGHDHRRRHDLSGDGLRPARPLVGSPLLAGALLLPLAHRQLRRRLRLHGVAHRPTRQRRHPRRVRVGGRPHAPVPRHGDQHRVGRGRPLPPAHRGRAAGQATPTARPSSGGCRARCSTSSRCATGARAW